MMVERKNRDKRINALHTRILETLSDVYYMHGNEIYAWVHDDLPSPAIFLRYLEDLERLGYVQFDVENGYIRTRLGTEILRRTSLKT